MSSKYPGGIISKTAPTPSGPYSDSTAPGVWTLEQQAYWQKLGQWPTQGNASPSAFIENLFSVYTYTGTGAAQTITNGINVSGNGGLVWVKARGNGNRSHTLFDSATYTTGQYYLATNIPNALLDTGTPGMFGLTTSGFSVQSTSAQWNASGEAFSSWTFRKQAKFFDIQTFTSSAGGNKTFNHNLGSVPGCVFIKNTQTSDPWLVYHRSVGDNDYLLLNTTDASAPQSGAFAATSTTFTINSNLMYNSQTYVAYLFAHDAGGFGTSGSENVISCGSWSTTLVGGRYDAIIDLGYEPQWVMFKPTNNTGSWQIYDNVRGWTSNAAGSNVSSRLYPNLANPEDTDTNTQIQYDGVGKIRLAVGASGYSGIYVAIRRGPMAVPTVGTNVFYPKTWTGTATYSNITDVGFSPDFFLGKKRAGSFARDAAVFDRLRGTEIVLYPSGTVAEQNQPGVTNFSLMTGYQVGPFDNVNSNSFFGPGQTYIHYSFKRAPSFFDEVCYVGDGNQNISGTVYNVTHNLGVLPELVIIKARSAAENWLVACALNSTQWVNGPTTGFAFNRNDPAATPINFSSSSYATSTTFRPAVVGGGYTGSGNDSGVRYVAYMFATVAGVSKVGSYTGTGATQTINCGFTAGSRFVMIKRTDSTGDWYYWDSARGIVPGNDPYLLMNTTADETTGTDYVDTSTTGFEISSTAPSAINANGGTFIFLAIA
jgi:hypothetical protein